MSLDLLLQAWIIEHRTAALDRIMVAVSAIGRGGLVWLAAGVALAAFHRLSPRRLLALAVAMLLAFAAADGVLKPLVDRTRPFVARPDLTIIGRIPGDASFPSGHAASSFAAAFVLSRSVPVIRSAWWLLAILVAYSRIYLGVHYPLDVIGGAILGIACAAVALPLAESAGRRKV